MLNLTRRSFFQGATLAVSATRVMGANDRVRVGVVGLGGRGSYHIGAWMETGEVEVTGLCDINQSARERAQAQLEKLGGAKAAAFDDMRKMYEGDTVDAVSIATPNHWHALATIWACEAGKDVYVEKPASHNIHEGWRMVETARQTKRMVQVGMQSRSSPQKRKAIQMLKDGLIGELYMAKGLCFKRRKSIGHTPRIPVPAGIDWNMFLGPAPMQPFSKNRYKYNWHWFWDTGNGDIGNQGVHQIDVCRWGLGLAMPKWAFASGAKYIYHDDQETPNTLLATLGYDRKREIVFEVRGLLTGPEAGLPVSEGNTVGNIFFGSDGWLWMGSEDGGGFRVYKGEKQEQVLNEGPLPGTPSTVLHMRNLLEACRSRKLADLHAPIEEGAISAALCHLANISYRVDSSKLAWDGAGQKFVNNPAADKLLTRQYRKPFVV